MYSSLAVTARCLILIAAGFLLPAPLLPAQDSGSPLTARIAVTVVDDTDTPVSAALVTVTPVNGAPLPDLETDQAGRCVFDGPPGTYRVRVMKKGYYPSALETVKMPETDRLEIELSHEQELSEKVDVVYSPARIDPKATASSQELTAQEIVNIPFPATRDVRNALPLISSAVQDASGQVHVNGAASSETQVRLDGFKISNPATGLMDARISSDAVRSIQLQSSRYSTEFGKASGGAFNLISGNGDDHFRFSTTDFVPSLQSRKGVHLNNWTPRATISGPIVKGKAWFYQAVDGEYGLDVIKELPEGADQNRAWRVSSLSKVQVSLGRSNILSGTWLINQARTDHAGLTPFDPLETTVDQRRAGFLAGLRDVSYLKNGMLIEFAVGLNENESDERPMGHLPYELHLEKSRGNYYRSLQSTARRGQFAAAVTVPAKGWHGNHQLKFGSEVDRVSYRLTTERRPIQIFDSQGALSREILFSSLSTPALVNYEIGHFVQDRWALSERWLLELGLRLDWDQVVRDPLLSPRFAASYLLRPGDKIAAGLGLFYDASSLDLLARPLSGTRSDLFSAGPTLQSRFVADRDSLKAPRSANWSVGWERQWTDSLLVNLEVVGRSLSRRWTYVSREPAAELRLLSLASGAHDSYRAVRVAVSHTGKKGTSIFTSCTLSSARSNQVLLFDPDNFVFGPQGAGPLPWDVPKQLVSWGWVPLTRRLQLSYSLDWRSGFPFSVLDQDQRLAEPPNSRRFPASLALNLHLEKRFRLASCEWAFRGGFNNITNHVNPSVVNNNVDSPDFLTYGGIQDRAFVGRIRFLGRK